MCTCGVQDGQRVTTRCGLGTCTHKVQGANDISSPSPFPFFPCESFPGIRNGKDSNANTATDQFKDNRPKFVNKTPVGQKKGIWQKSIDLLTVVDKPSNSVATPFKACLSFLVKLNPFRLDFSTAMADAYYPEEVEASWDAVCTPNTKNF